MSRWFRRPVSALVAGASLVVPGCGHDPTGERQTPLEFSVFPAEQWSGGAVQVRVRGFRDRDSIESVVAGDSTVGWSWADDSTINVLLTGVPSSTAEIRITARGVANLAGTVRVYGYRSTSGLGLSLAGISHVREIGGNPVVVGVASDDWNDSDPMGWVDLVTGATQVIPGLRTPGGTAYGPSVTNDPLEFVLSDSGHAHYTIWRIGPTPVVAESLPYFDNYPLWRHVVRLSDSMWMVTRHHDTCTFPPGVIWRCVQAESPYAVYLSPRGDRTTFEVAGTLDGVPVFDNVTGDTVFRLPFRTMEGAAFSADGAHLYGLGGNRYDSLVVVDAGTGAVEGTTVLPTSGLALAVEESQDRVYVLGASSGATELLVYRLSTMSLEATLSTPGGCRYLEPLWGWCWMGVIAPDPVRNRVFVVFPAADLAVRWEFDLLPEPTAR